MSVKDNIKKFYAFSFLGELMFIIPVIVIFWQENGLSLTQIMFLQSIFAIALVLFEVPTGVIADKIGRKQSIVFGAFILFISSIVYSLSYNFWEFAIAEIVWAIGLTCISGADSAFIYDSLKQNRKEKEYKKVWGKAKSFGYASAGIASVVGGLVAGYSLRLNWYLEAVFLLIMFFVALRFVEPKVYKKTNETSYFKHAFVSFEKLFKSRPLIILFIFSAMLATILKISLWFYQPYMQQSNIPLIYFGVIWASFHLFAIIGSNSAHRLEGYLGQKKSLWFIVIGVTLSMIFMSWWFALFGIVFIFLQQFIRGFSPPVILDYTNKLITSRERATLLSIKSLGGSLGFAILGPIFGYIADTYSLSTSLLVLGISFFIAFSIILSIKNEKSNA